MPSQLDDPFDYATPPTDEGARLNTLLILAAVLPYIVAVRVGFADALDAQDHDLAGTDPAGTDLATGAAPGSAAADPGATGEVTGEREEYDTAEPADQGGR